jgi:hypothetical protein
LVSRLLILIILAAVPAFSHIPAERWKQDDRTTIKLSGQQLADAVRRVAIVNDAGWYWAVARDGYEKRPFDTSRQASWAFFPLHPLLWRQAAAITGEWIWSGVLVANLSFLLALVLLWRLVLNLTDNPRLADSAVVFACFWPATYFMSLPHTEPLFFALVCASMLAGSYRSWGFAGTLGAFASAARFNGIFLAPAFAAVWLRGERRLRDLIALAPIAGGLIAYMAYLWLITGNPLAFKDIQVAWGRQLTVPWSALLQYLSHPHKIVRPWNPEILNFSAAILAIASVVTCWRKGWRDMAIFTGLTLLAPLSTGTLTSMTRYLSVAPGMFLALAVWTEGWPRLGQMLTAGFCIALAIMCILFVLGSNIAGA